MTVLTALSPGIACRISGRSPEQMSVPRKNNGSDKKGLRHRRSPFAVPGVFQIRLAICHPSRMASPMLRFSLQRSTIRQSPAL